MIILWICDLCRVKFIWWRFWTYHSQPIYLKNWSKKNFIIQLIISEETDLLCVFSTQVLFYSMIIMYRNDLELEWQQTNVLELVVAGWGLTSCRVQMNNSIDKLMIEIPYHNILSKSLFGRNKLFIECL